MAEIQQKEEGGRKKGKQKKFNIHVDFTPMVDMNMLLITFFMLCTSMSKPQTMEISMPRKDLLNEQEQNKVKASKAITILLGKEGKVYYYVGEPNYDDPDLLKETDFSSNGLRALLLGRNRFVVQKIRELKQKRANLEITNEEYMKQSSEIRKDKDSPVVLIKATDFASYKNLIDALDEMQICNIGRYAIMDITPGDLRLLQDLTHDGYAEDLKEVVRYVELKQ
ncbi:MULTISPECIES: ExbD/TolR family protein [Porphyromonadaceae]|uniref:Biopolymer transporter ExbD n=1 Tax=Sanguibacteroides justesenii TaxID=1547597 RepID=A0A0C3R400_9PORP|nr:MULTISPECIES: biopolymer transporter ExbD [Porphyromonadaceae]KIO44035.1 biopolymer transporter ExbD [Sanguibacteroides justesenii]KIO47305.1 biopolymer transporter ExbD [Sanguibacteroides justesenii]MCR9012708.1 biopolymer transporter ExbD [Gabonibacter chumensis]PXZ43927.1 biopolymer transporter ExbD [Sanguibacteroides justesenii]